MKLCYSYFIIFIISLFSLILFALGFFKVSIPVLDTSLCNDPLMTNTLYANHYSLTCWSKPKFKRIVYGFLDALRYDSAFSTENKQGLGHMPHMRTLGNSDNTQRFHFVAHYPTTTAQRLKALFTGVVPSFIEAGNTLAQGGIVEDSFVKQVFQQKKRFVVVGDRVWDKSFGKYLYKTFTSRSNNVADRDSTDILCDRHYEKEIKDDANDVTVFHPLGLDHTGHYYLSVSGEPFIKKLKWFDEFAYKLFVNNPKDSLLILAGDHGMTNDGNHGGGSYEELHAALLLHSPFGLGKRYKNSDTLMQIDIVPTMALAIGVPIPFSNLGTPIRSVFLVDENDITQIHDYVNALNVTSNQIIRYLKSFENVNFKKMSWLRDMQTKLKGVVREEIDNFFNKEVLMSSIEKHEGLLHEIEKKYIEDNATYVMPLMVFGAIGGLMVFIICLMVSLNVELDITVKEVLIIISSSIVLSLILMISSILTNLANALICSLVFCLSVLITYKLSIPCFNGLLQKTHVTLFSLISIVIFGVYMIISQNGTSFIYKESSIMSTTIQFLMICCVVCVSMFGTTGHNKTVGCDKNDEELNGIGSSEENLDDFASAWEGAESTNEIIGELPNTNREENELKSVGSPLIDEETKVIKPKNQIFKFLLYFKGLTQSKYFISIGLLMLIVFYKKALERKYLITSNSESSLFIVFHIAFKLVTATGWYKLLHLLQSFALIICFNTKESYYPLIIYISISFSCRSKKAFHTTLLLITSVLLPFEYTPIVLSVDFFYYFIRRCPFNFTPILFCAINYFMFINTNHGPNFNKIHFNAGFIGINTYNFILNGILILFDTFIFPSLAAIQSYFTNGPFGLLVITAFQAGKAFGAMLFICSQPGQLNVKTLFTQLSIFDWLDLIMVELVGLGLLIASTLKKKK